jgi:predicted dienelactone hydrolase
MWYPALNPSGREEAYTYDLNGLVTEGRALPAAAPNLTDGPYPVIFYSHGLFGARFESTAYLEHLASWGFVVIAADHSGTTFFNITSAEDVVRSFANRPLEILRLIAHAEALNSEGDYTGLFDTNRLAITGFSFGGYTALLAGGASIDTRALAAACEGVSVEESALCAPTSLDLLAWMPCRRASGRLWRMNAFGQSCRSRRAASSSWAWRVWRASARRSW